MGKVIWTIFFWAVAGFRLRRKLPVIHQFLPLQHSSEKKKKEKHKGQQILDFWIIFFIDIYIYIYKIKVISTATAGLCEL